MTDTDNDTGPCALAPVSELGATEADADAEAGPESGLGLEAPGLVPDVGGGLRACAGAALPIGASTPWSASSDADADAANDGSSGPDAEPERRAAPAPEAASGVFTSADALLPPGLVVPDPDLEFDPKMRTRAAWYCTSRSLRFLSELSAASAALGLVVVDAACVGRLRMRMGAWKAAAGGRAFVEDVEDAVAMIAGIGRFVSLFECYRIAAIHDPNRHCTKRCTNIL